MAHWKMRMEAGRQREPKPTGNEDGLPFPPSLLYGSQPPVKAALRIASLGLDRAWLRSERKCPKRRKWQGFGLANGRSNTRRSAPDTVLKTNELTNLLTRPAFSWKGRNRTALHHTAPQRYLVESSGLKRIIKTIAPQCPASPGG